MTSKPMNAYERADEINKLVDKHLSALKKEDMNYIGDGKTRSLLNFLRTVSSHADLHQEMIRDQHFSKNRT